LSGTVTGLNAGFAELRWLPSKSLEELSIATWNIPKFKLWT
jgi:hypothetical protein